MNAAAIYKWGAGVAGALLAAAANFMWSEVQSHGADLQTIKAERASDHELLQEVRGDVKEIRDAVRRMEGANDSNAP